MPLSHRERLERTLSNQQTDRPPVALWHHFPIDDQQPDTLAAATTAFQKQFDFDLVKIMPPSSFCLKDWGSEDEWQGNEEGTRTYTRRVIQKPEDWQNLRQLDPQKGYLGKQISCLKTLRKFFQDGTPLIQTIFNPLSQVKNLVGPDRLPVFIREYPEALLEGLNTITETTINFLKLAKKTGIDGIFFAVQHATAQILTKKEYLKFGKTFDLPILAEAKDLWINMAHLHGNDLYFQMMADYPIDVLNWHDRETPPNLKEAQKKFKGTVCGGLSRIKSMLLGNPDVIFKEALDAYAQTNGKKFILGTGCVLPITTPYGNIMAARQIVEELRL